MPSPSQSVVLLETLSLHDADDLESSSGSLALPVISEEHYAIEGVHARGAFGRILKARDRRLDRIVAIKELARPGHAARARFLREIRLTARLQHPSIVPLYEAGRWPSQVPFYTMKFVCGKALGALSAAAIDLDARLSLVPHVGAAAEAITYAHAERVIHRDLTPSNVLVGRFGETLVIDWGLAKRLDHRAPESWLFRDSTLRGTVLGTPAYMAPEQARGGDVDERADVYALGALLYHTLTGRAPYSGAPLAILQRVTSEPPPPPAQLDPRLPGALTRLVERAMERDAGRRLPSAAAFADELFAALGGALRHSAQLDAHKP